MELALVFAVLFFALVFTYTNGFHDTANVIATIVGTKVLTPRQADAGQQLKAGVASSIHPAAGGTS